MKIRHLLFVVCFGILCTAAVIKTATFSRVESGTWQRVSSNNFLPRAWFTSSVVGGKIYVIGGYGDSVLATGTQMYDPASNTWTTLQTSGTFTQRASLASCVLNDKIYVFGGAIGPEQPSNMSNALEIFDPKTNQWTTPQTTGTFTPRNNLCACAIDGKIYALGGYDAHSPGDLNILEVFDPVTNTWTTPQTTGTFTPHGAFTANVVNGKIYAIGGFNDHGTRGHRVLSSVEVFDPKTNVWSTPVVTGAFQARLLHASGIVNNKIYIIGGTPDMVNPLTSNVVQMFDPATDSWSTPITTGIFTPRSYLSASVVNDRIYVMGGQDTAKVFNAVEMYTPNQ